MADLTERLIGSRPIRPITRPPDGLDDGERPSAPRSDHLAQAGMVGMATLDLPVSRTEPPPLTPVRTLRDRRHAAQTRPTP